MCSSMPTFRALFGRDVEVRADAPGRVNLIGEHTDYNGGYVLPVAIPQRTRVELAARSDRMVRLWSAQAPGPVVTYMLGREARDGSWTDYVKGMTCAVARYGELAGFDMRVDSEVPVGSGLSSSAALEIAVGRALRARFHLQLDDLDLARAGQRGENELVGAPVGIMDQMAAVFADTATALFVDTRTLAHTRVALPAPGGIIVIDSGISHRHAGGEYAKRRAECEEAALRLGVAQLRDVGMTDLDRVSLLPPPLDRRARHIIAENQRVLDTVDAFGRGDLAAAGRLFNDSHVSMRDDFEISLPAIDRLVAIAQEADGVYGARLTGGGFGGAVVILADTARLPGAAASIVAGYAKAGHSGGILVPPILRNTDTESA